MASYHSSFTYLNQNSADEGFMIASFEPDSGFVDSFLDMEQIVTDSYNGVEKFFYGNKYASTAMISITIVKADGSDFSVADNRKVLRWLTGNRQASWLDLYEGKDFAYSFFGSVVLVQQQKLDGRIIGIKIDFSSIHPWAWSAPQSFHCYVGEEMLEIDEDGTLYKGGDSPYLGVDENGVLYNNESNEIVTFNKTITGIVYNDSSVELQVDNQSDDLYSYTNLNLIYNNESSTALTITNTTLDEETLITDISENEVITISSGQFIVSDIPNKIFGDSFNFVWPRLCPGVNNIIVDMVDGLGKGSFEFSYRYPIKIGDCAVDVENLTSNPVLCRKI